MTFAATTWIRKSIVRNVLSLLAAIIVLSADVADGHAQSVSKIPRAAQNDGPSIIRIPRGKRLRVQWDQKRVTGAQGVIVGDTLYLGTEAARIGIPAHMIDTLWVSRDSAPFITIGAVGGALGLGVFAATAGAHLCESPSGCEDDNATVTLLGAAVGAVGGALLGSTVSKLIGRWKRIYP